MTVSVGGVYEYTGLMVQGTLFETAVAESILGSPEYIKIKWIMPSEILRYEFPQTY